MVKASDVRKGMVLVLEGELYVVTEFEHIAPGNWRAMNQIKCKHMTTGAARQMRKGSGEDLEQAYLDRRNCSYLYKDGEQFVFMDSENFEQYFLGEDLVGDAMKWVKENQDVELTFFEGEPVNITLPSAVVLQVSEAEMAAKGDSVTNDKKGATLETGAEIRVPMYIEAGEWVKVSTDSGDFLSRAKEGETP